MDSALLRPKFIIKYCLLILLLTLPLSVYCSPQQAKLHTITIQGKVLSDSGKPLEGALIIAFTSVDDGRYSCVKAMSDQLGFFRLKIRAKDFVGLIIVKDCEETPGLDYLPKMIFLPVTSSYNVELKEVLSPGATVIIKLPTSIRGFKVKCHVWVDVKDKIIKYDFSEYLRLVDAVKRDSALLSVLGDPLKISDIRDVVLMIPAEVRFEIFINLFIETTLERVLFKFNNSSYYYKLSQGELLKLDFRRELIVKVGLSKLYREYREIKLKLSHLEKSGFSLLNEQRTVFRVLTLLKEVEEDLGSGRYASAEIKSAIASKLLRGIRKTLNSYVFEVESYLKLVTILALLISILLSLIITKSLKTLMLLSTLIYALQVVVIKISPPSHLVGDQCVISNSLIYYGAFVTLIYVVRLIERGVKRVSVTMNFIVDSITLAVNNIKRRRTLNILLAISVFIVMISYLSVVSVEQISEVKSESYNVELDLNAILVKIINRSAPLPNYVPLSSSLILSVGEQVNAIDVCIKLESLPPAWDNYVNMKCLSDVPEPLGYVVKGEKRVPIMGVIGIYPSRELRIINLSSALIIGNFIEDSDSDSALLSVDLAKELNVSVGDRVVVKVSNVVKELLIKGIINATKLAEFKDLSNEPYTPFVLEFSSVTSEGGELLYYPVRAVNLNKGLVILTADIALNLGCVASRALFLLPEDVDSVKLAKELAENFELDVWAIKKGEVQHFYVITLTKVVGGFEIGVLLTIVMSLVASLVMNMVYERKREFSIMSTLGFNPTHLQAVLIAELLFLIIIPSFLSIVLSFIGIPRVLITIGVTRTAFKINVEHTLTALFLIIIISVISSQPIIAKSIKALSPNIPIKWILERKSYNEVNVPVKVHKELINDFLIFIEKALKEKVRFSDKSSEYLVYIHELRRAERRDTNTHILTLDFVMSFHASWRYFRTRCKLMLKRGIHEEYYEMMLYLEPIELHGFHKEHVSYYVGDLIRRIALKWSVGERT